MSFKTALAVLLLLQTPMSFAQQVAPPALLSELQVVNGIEDWSCYEETGHTCPALGVTVITSQRSVPQSQELAFDLLVTGPCGARNLQLLEDYSGSAFSDRTLRLFTSVPPGSDGCTDSGSAPTSVRVTVRAGFSGHQRIRLKAADGGMIYVNYDVALVDRGCPVIDPINPVLPHPPAPGTCVYEVQNLRVSRTE